MSISQKAIGQRLRTAREKQGISRKDAAQAVGISNVLLSRIETGKSTITIELLVKLCAYLMISETEILLGIDVPSDIGIRSYPPASTTGGGGTNVREGRHILYVSFANQYH